MSQHPNKRMIYIWEENRAFYDNLKNKSEVINKYLTDLQKDDNKAEDNSDFEAKLRQIDERNFPN